MDKKSRRQLAARFGFPDRKSSVKILRKLNLAHVDIHLLLELSRALRDPYFHKIYCHLDEIHSAHVWFLQSDLCRRMTPAFLQSLSAWQDRWLPTHRVREARDVIRLETQLGVRQPKWNSIEMMRERHDQLVQIARHQMNYIAADLPPPPVELSAKEKDWIVPLQNGYALIEEGTMQQHCLGTMEGHQDNAARGRFYAWAIHGEERATLALQCVSNRWEIYDVRRARNEMVSTRLQRLALDFVQRANGQSVETGMARNDSAVEREAAMSFGREDAWWGRDYVVL